MPGPNGWLSWPMPVRVRRVPASTVAARWRSAGSVTLRLPGSPGTTWTGMLQASSRAASSVNVSGPFGREAPPGLAEQVPADALRRLRGPEPRPLDRRPDQVAVDPLERLRDAARPGSPPRAGRWRPRPPRRAPARPAAGPRRGRGPPRSASGAWRSSAANPAWTDSCRRSPPATTSDDARRQPARGRHLGPSLGRGDDDDPADLAAPRRARRASRRAAADRRSRRRACRCRPSGSTGRRRRR